jgi:Zn-dependent protease
MYEIRGITFYESEVRDLAIAWVALGVAFTFFLTPTGFVPEALAGVLDFETMLQTFLLSMLTVGTGFLLHELAHKVVAVEFGQIAAFRADFGMLGIAIASGLAGFLVAAPGAVYHRGRLSLRENGLISVAGPATNLGLAVVFFLPFLVTGGLLQQICHWGVVVNLFLATFNMIPFGALDGKTVREWDGTVFGAVLAVAAGSMVGFMFLFGFPSPL